MEAIAQEEAIINTTTSPKDQTTLVVKGKRTKRLRPQSPIPCSFAVATSSNENSTPATSAEPDTEDEEDMANCLILLAQGRRSPPPGPPPPHQQQQQSSVTASYKFNSRRFLADHHQSTGGSYVYECKTCNRTFPSFQALGGHRASHKKTPKSLNLSLSENNNNKKTHTNHHSLFSAGFPSDEEDNLHTRNHFKPNVMTLSLHLSTTRNHNNHISNEVYGSASKAASNKVHECSICGAEFTSGQALGGHMRRHRAAPSTATTALSLSPSKVNVAATPLMAVEPELENHDDRHQARKRVRSVLSLDLDLNLPAPEDDKNQHRESRGNNKLGGFLNSKQQQSQQQQQQQQQQQSSLVFTTPALVDCHY